MIWFVVGWVAWQIGRGGLRADREGLEWWAIFSFRKRVAHVPWTDIKSTRLLKVCKYSEEYCILLRLREGAPNPVPYGKRERLVVVYDEEWVWQPQEVKEAIDRYLSEEPT